MLQPVKDDLSTPAEANAELTERFLTQANAVAQLAVKSPLLDQDVLVEPSPW